MARPWKIGSKRITPAPQTTAAAVSSMGRKRTAPASITDCEVFRDMGFAFAMVLILICGLVVFWFESFTVPLVIMAPIPLTLVGILPAHWAMGAFFTATSMIGFIAGAGIVVRNSIILVDFIELRLVPFHRLDNLEALRRQVPLAAEAQDEDARAGSDRRKEKVEGRGSRAVAARILRLVGQDREAVELGRYSFVSGKADSHFHRGPFPYQSNETS
jgi:AcrB/AcrD/AcrF family